MTKTILNVIALTLAIISVIFKLNQMPEVSIPFVLSIAMILVLLFFYAFKDNKEAGMSQSLNYLLIGTLSLFAIGFLLAEMHWYYIHLISIIATLIAVITSGLLVFLKQTFTVSKQYIIVFFIYMILLISLSSFS